MAHETSKPEERIAYTPGQLQTILLVEDEKMVRELVRRILQAHGYAVLEAHRGADALRICRQHPGPIHLLLTNVVVPEMGGPCLAEQVAAWRPRTRVLYMSGHQDGTFLARLDLTTRRAFLPKPFTPDALVHKVREVLGGP